MRWSTLIRRTRTRQYEVAEDAGPLMDPRWQIAQVTVSPSGRTAFLEGSSVCTQPDEDSTTDDDTDDSHEKRELERLLSQMDSSMGWVLENTILPCDEGRDIAQQIIMKKARCISDGSLKDRLGTSASTFMNERKSSTYITRNRVTGQGEHQSSYRSELCGILANILILNTIAELHDIQEGRVVIACDNESALWMSFGRKYATTKDSCFDLLKVIHHAIANSRIEWVPKHVEGHQDDKADNNLDEWARANIEVDREAGEYWEHMYGTGERDRPSPSRMTGEGWRVSLEGRPIVDAMAQQIYHHVYYKKCMDYWTRKGRILPGMGEKVDWTTYDGALQLLPYGKRQWVRKHFCGFEGTNLMMHKQGKRRNAFCPKCEKIECHRHITKCQSNDATVAFRHIRQEFEQWLHTTTSPGLRDAILEHLRAYREDERISEGEHWADIVKTASQTQETIGPNAFAEGCITSQWGEIQSIHLAAIKSRRQSSRWTKELIKKLWLVSWDMWANRNGWIHKEAVVRQEQISAHLDDEVTRIHELGHAQAQFYPEVDRQFFMKPANEIKRMTDYQKRTWITAANKIIERDRQHLARNQETQQMREFLQPGSTQYVARNQTRIIQRGDSDTRNPEELRRGIVNHRT